MFNKNHALPKILVPKANPKHSINAQSTEISSHFWFGFSVLTASQSRAEFPSGVIHQIVPAKQFRIINKTCKAICDRIQANKWLESAITGQIETKPKKKN